MPELAIYLFKRISSVFEEAFDLGLEEVGLFFEYEVSGAFNFEGLDFPTRLSEWLFAFDMINFLQM
tara:strand:+ start:373 stop:570 length:198 start_codon:yes stop_codon:yes gene_type:complete